MHNGLVGLVLEVAVPATPEFWTRPLVHNGELFLSGADLHTGFNAVGRERASAVDIPLLEHLLLDLGIATHEIVKRFNVRLSAVGSERQTGKD